MSVKFLVYLIHDGTLTFNVPLKEETGSFKILKCQANIGRTLGVDCNHSDIH
jgi:hypothetical protein